MSTAQTTASRMDQVLDEIADEDARSLFGGDPIEDEDLGPPDQINDGIEAIEGAPQSEQPPAGEEADPNPSAEEAPAGDQPEEPPAEEPPAEEPPAEEPPAEEPPAEEPQPDIRIPKARLDKEIERRKALERKLAEYEEAATKPASPEVALDVDTLGPKAKAMFDKVLDGDLDTATANLAELLGTYGKQVVESTLEQMRGEVAGTYERGKEMDTFEATVTELKAAFPQLDDGNPETFDEAAAADVVETRDIYIAKGYDPAAALRKAVDLTARDYGWTAPAKETPPQESPVAAARRESAVQRNVDAARRTPPSVEPSPEPQESTPDINKMTEEEYFALPETTRARLRGDTM